MIRLSAQDAANIVRIVDRANQQRRGEVTSMGEHSNQIGEPAGASWRPQPKVAAGGIAGALATVVVFILATAGVEVPDVVATAIGALATAGLAYFVPNTDAA